MFSYVRADIHHYTRVESSLSAKIATLFFNLGFHAVILYRLSSFLYHHHLWALGLVVSYFSSVWTGAQISCRAKIGRGFVVLHPSGIVIGATTVIGENCMLSGRNSIGQGDKPGLRPVIGDNFIAGSGACILGGIKVGNKVLVAANTLVTEDLPDSVEVYPYERPKIRFKVCKK